MTTVPPEITGRRIGAGKRIGTIELAAKLGLHPMSIPRLVKAKRLPPPDKIFGKNCWFAEEIDDYVARLVIESRAKRAPETASRAETAA